MVQKTLEGSRRLAQTRLLCRWALSGSFSGLCPAGELDSHLVAQGSQNDGAKKQEAETVSLMLGHWPSMDLTGFH